MSSDCKIYTLLDKKVEKSMTLCIVLNGSKTCYVSTCTCPQKARQSRAVSSTVYETDAKDKASSKKDSQCRIMPSGNHHFISTHHFRTESRKDNENLTKFINASELSTETENIMNRDVPLRGLCILFTQIILHFHIIL